MTNQKIVNILGEEERYDLVTQKEYAIAGQLDNELKEEEEDNILVDQQK